MREAAKTVRLPAIAALFHDISSTHPMRPWSLRPESPSARHSRRKTPQPSDDMPASVGMTCGNDAANLQSVNEVSCEAVAGPSLPLSAVGGDGASAAHLSVSAEATSNNELPQCHLPPAVHLRSATHAQRANGFKEPQTAQSSKQPSGSENAAECSNGVEETRGMPPSQATTPPTLRSEGLNVREKFAVDRAFHSTAAVRSVNQQQTSDNEICAAIDLECPSPEAPQLLPQQQQQQQRQQESRLTLGGGHHTSHSTSAPQLSHMQGMGRITSGVVRAAALKQAAEHTQEHHQQEAPRLPRLHGLSRGLWQTAWDAHLPVSDEEEDIWLGSFSSQECAARAHDIAALHSLGLDGSSLPTNIQAEEYNSGLADLKGLPRTDVVDVLRRAVPVHEFQQESKFKGVYPHGIGWEARYPVETLPSRR